MQNPVVGQEIDYLAQRIKTYLNTLCITIPDRPVGSQGNQDAVDFFDKTIRSFGFETECKPFDCIDWTYGKVSLKAGQENFEAFVGPYSLSCDVSAPLVEASSPNKLEETDCSNKILILHGDIAKEQMMPKNFPFYNPENHQKIIALLEHKRPAAIIAATGRNSEAVGALYPFPLFEDGDFDIPSIYMKDYEGGRLLEHVSENITLKFDSNRIPSTGSNVIALKGNQTNPRIVFCAHIDTRKGTPGALDDGGGTATLLALAELLKTYSDTASIEIIAFNGEDYYAASGQKQYLAQYKSSMEQIILAINLDDVGYFDGRTCFSFYECSDEISHRISNIFNNRHGFYKGEPWYQGDHMIFVLNHRPAMALISEGYQHLMKEVVHTEKDTVDLVDYTKLAEIACALRDIALELCNF